MADAIAFVERVVDPGEKAKGLIRLIPLCARVPHQARALVSRAFDCVREAKASIRIAVLGGAANALAEIGLEAEAAELARQAVAVASENTSSGGAGDGLGEAALAFASTGQFSEAHEAARMIRVQGYSPDWVFARTLCRRSRALNGLAEALASAGQQEQAVAAAHSALDAANAALRLAAAYAGDDVLTRSQALTLAASALVRIGDREQAGPISRQALDLALNNLRNLGAIIPDPKRLAYRANVERSVRDALAVAGALNEDAVDAGVMAIHIAESVVGPRHKAGFLSSVALLLAETGSTGDGLGVLLSALDAAKLAGRATVLEVLADTATTLASVDNGELLSKLCEELEQVEAWFGTSQAVH